MAVGSPTGKKASRSASVAVPSPPGVTESKVTAGGAGWLRAVPPTVLSPFSIGKEYVLLWILSDSRLNNKLNVLSSLEDPP